MKHQYFEFLHLLLDSYDIDQILGLLLMSFMKMLYFSVERSTMSLLSFNPTVGLFFLLLCLPSFF